VTVADGTMCHPHLPTDQYPLADTTAVPARRGDIVCFNINTIHGSYLNTTSEPRRLVRMGYRHPDNAQLGGQAMGRPGVMVLGTKPRRPGQEPYSTEA
jgi:phytanoyl-CoA hydroxylase